RQLFWINGIWKQSSASGSIMIRPVVGKSIITSINDIQYRNKTKLHFWPNPANDYITFDSQELPVSDLIYISVFDLQGRQLLNVPFSERIDISSLREGIYIVVANLNGRSIGYNRLVRIK
ncbi:MAG: T9SS type A sorting domain-containing protein, partial [Bacteroidia bacterium]|nr:T9SS type A sorting domain-containing protein [Bacteroidia bacterium]